MLAAFKRQGIAVGYLRLLRLDNNTLHDATEQADLIALLTSYPEVSAVKIDGIHPKGGYRVNCTIAGENIEHVLSQLWLNGWLSAL